MSYVTTGGRSVVKDWYNEQSTRVKAKFTVRLDYLLSADRMDWKREPYGNLTGSDGLGEIRFETDKVQQRPLGFFGPGDRQFTILFHAIEKGDKLKPKKSQSIAQKRKDAILSGNAKIEACNWLWADDDEENAK